MLPNFSNPLPGIPAVESPFFDSFFDPTEDKELYRVAKSLHEDGFAVLDFPDSDILALSDEIKAEFAGRFEWDAWKKGERHELRVQDAWKDNDHVKRIATNDAVLKLLEKLYGRKAFPFQTLNFPVGTQQHFHTDSVHFSSMPQRFMVGVWLAMEDIGPDQGPLVYYPGTHKWPVYTNEHLGHPFVESQRIADYGSVWVRLVEQAGVKPKRFLPKKGQAAIWAANLLHGGDAHNDRDLTRWSQVTHYFFEGCSYYTPFFSDPFMGSIYFREPTSVLTGDVVANTCNGLDVPVSFIQNSVPAKVSGEIRSTVPADFDGEAYLMLNPDVKAAGVDPVSHYLHHGMRENRSYRAS